MYNASHFRESNPELLYGFIRDNPLALLVTPDLQATHLPVLLDEARGCLRAHMARANPHWKALNGASVLAVFGGPSHYISPSWYPTKREHGKVVPTWNYVTVHVRGLGTVHENADWLLPHLNELTDQNEGRISSEWKVADAPEDFIHAQAKAIVGLEIKIEEIDGKWKVSQNRPAEDQQGVIAALENRAEPRSAAMAKLVAEKSRRSV
jgi:transcriptional regulator